MLRIRDAVILFIISEIVKNRNLVIEKHKICEKIENILGKKYGYDSTSPRISELIGIKFLLPGNSKNSYKVNPKWKFNSEDYKSYKEDSSKKGSTARRLDIFFSIKDEIKGCSDCQIVGYIILNILDKTKFNANNILFIIKMLDLESEFKHISKDRLKKLIKWYVKRSFVTKIEGSKYYKLDRETKSLSAKKYKTIKQKGLNLLRKHYPDTKFSFKKSYFKFFREFKMHSSQYSIFLVKARGDNEIIKDDTSITRRDTYYVLACNKHLLSNTSDPDLDDAKDLEKSDNDNNDDENNDNNDNNNNNDNSDNNDNDDSEESEDNNDNNNDNDDSKESEDNEDKNSAIKKLILKQNKIDKKRKDVDKELYKLVMERKNTINKENDILDDILTKNLKNFKPD